MTRGQVFAWILAVVFGSWLSWRLDHAQRNITDRALDIVRAHFDEMCPVGVIASPGW